jgi:hypothetical protein
MALKPTAILTKEIASIGRAGVKLTRMIQDAAVNAIGYSLVHGDITIGQRLFEACPKGVRRNSLVAYLEKFGAFQWDAKSKSLRHRKTEIEFTEQYEQDLMNTAWDDAKPEPEIVSVYDVQKEFDKFIKRMEKLRQDAEITLHHKALLDSLQETSSQYNARLMLGEAADKAVL